MSTIRAYSRTMLATASAVGAALGSGPGSQVFWVGLLLRVVLAGPGAFRCRHMGSLATVLVQWL